MAILDSGCSSVYLQINSPCVNKKTTKNPISVSLPNGTILKSTHEAELKLTMLPKTARRAHILPNLNNGALISISQLCNSGCRVIFDAPIATIMLNGRIILIGNRNYETGLYEVNIDEQEKPKEKRKIQFDKQEKTK